MIVIIFVLEFKLAIFEKEKKMVKNVYLKNNSEKMALRG